MKLSRILAAAFLVPFVLAAPRTMGQSPVTFTAHEWGTFTSIAAADGTTLEWLPLAASSGLPNFVEHLHNANFKGGLRGTIRMETPVLYFYSPQETTVSVHVAFSQGLITEWYPHADVPAITAAQKNKDGTISWPSVEIDPTTSADFPVEAPDSPYYAARETSSASLAIATSSGTQHEKFLFYRGVSTVSPPLFPAISTDGAVTLGNQRKVGDAASTLLAEQKSVRQNQHNEAASPCSAGVHASALNAAKNPSLKSDSQTAAIQPTAMALGSEANTEIPNAILFERRGSRVGFRIFGPLHDQVTFAPPLPDGSLESLFSDLEGMLIAQGLFADEAHAMLETWKSSWFEEGSRVLYVVPRSFVDSILPLTITPAPAQLTRVFVGRVELITPATQQAVACAFAANDRATLAKYARFLEPILRTMLDAAQDEPTRDQLTAYLDSVFTNFYSQPRD